MDIQASPPLRQHSEILRLSEGRELVVCKDPKKLNFSKAWDIIKRLGRKIDREKLGYPNLIDVFEHVLRHFPEEKKYISPFVLDHISDLEIFTRALKEVENYYPWAATFEYEYLARVYSFTFLFPDRTCNTYHFTQENYKLETEYYAKRESPFTQTVGNFDDGRLYINLFGPNDSFMEIPTSSAFRYPHHGRTETNKNQIITAEMNLELIGEKFERNWMNTVGRDFMSCFGDIHQSDGRFIKH